MWIYNPKIEKRKKQIVWLKEAGRELLGGVLVGGCFILGLIFIIIFQN